MMIDDRTWMQWLQGEWWWHVSRRLTAEKFRIRIAWLIPRKVALWVFIRVFAAGDPELRYQDAYRDIYHAWEKGAGR